MLEYMTFHIPLPMSEWEVQGRAEPSGGSTRKPAMSSNGTRSGASELVGPRCFDDPSMAHMAPEITRYNQLHNDLHVVRDALNNPAAMVRREPNSPNKLCG